jgi:hypothetical protein
MREKILSVLTPTRWRVPSSIAAEVCDVESVTIVEVRLVLRELRPMVVAGLVETKGPRFPDDLRFRAVSR